jgi:hypothetical protein
MRFGEDKYIKIFFVEKTEVNKQNYGRRVGGIGFN